MKKDRKKYLYFSNKLETLESLPLPEKGSEEVIADLAKEIADAYNEALINKIEANTVIINEKYAKTNSAIYPGPLGGHWDFPPMLYGLNVAFSDLPEKFAFALAKTNIKTSKQLEEEVIKETAREILEEIMLRSVFTVKNSKEYTITESALKDLAMQYGIELFENFEELEEEE